MFSKVLYKISGFFYRVHRLFFNAAGSGKNLSVSDINKKKWYADKGDKTYRLDYPLSPSSVVFDVGGYEGDWAAEISARYGCKVHIFEPVPTFIDVLKKRFAANPAVCIHPFGLSDREGKADFHMMEEASSLHRSASPHKKGTVISVTMRDVSDVFKEENIDRVALLKINIEGGEYELLPAILSRGLAASIDNIQVQFHDFVPGAEEKMKKIQDSLSKTHTLTWSYPFVWENWKIRS